MISEMYRQYHTQFRRQLNCWSLRCRCSIPYRPCSNYIFILHFKLGFNILRKGNCKPRRETFKFWDSVRLILEILRFLTLWQITDTMKIISFSNEQNVCWYPSNIWTSMDTYVCLLGGLVYFRANVYWHAALLSRTSLKPYMSQWPDIQNK